MHLDQINTFLPREALLSISASRFKQETSSKFGHPGRASFSFLKHLFPRAVPSDSSKKLPTALTTSTEMPSYIPSVSLSEWREHFNEMAEMAGCYCCQYCDMLSESPEPTPSYDDVESLILHIQEDTNFSDETLRVQHVALKIQDGWALPEWAKLKDDPFHKGHILADLQFQHLDDNVDWDKIDEAVQRMIEIEASRNGGDGGDGGDDAKENIGGQ